MIVTPEKFVRKRPAGRLCLVCSTKLYGFELSKRLKMDVLSEGIALQFVKF